MRHEPKIKNRYKKVITVFVSIVFAMSVFMPLGAYAQGLDQKTVRVGWYESLFNSTGADGSRSGYAYEYQQKIAAYTGWKYEYVEGSWVELLQMVQNGEIDLMTDVSYTEERAETMLYSELPMGTENYYLYVAGSNTSISPEDLSALNGKTIGVNKDSYQEMLLWEWAEAKGVHIEIAEQTGSDEDSLQKVQNGELDGYVSLDAFEGFGEIVPVFQIGSSDFYFVVNSDREDLLTELNTALTKIQDEDRDYNQKLWNKHVSSQGLGASRYLTANEVNWLNQHGTIRVGYRDNYLPFSGTDSETGEATGLLKDYLDTASTLFRNAEIDFELVAYPNTQEAKEALINGEVDCVFPLSLSLSEAEDEGLLVSNAVVESQMELLVSKKNYSNIDLSGSIRFAVNEGNVSYEKILNEYFPNCEIVYFADIQSCFKGVADGKADGILVSSYRVSTVSKYLDDYQLVAMDTSATNECNFAMKVGNVYLYSILNKVRNLTSDSYVQNMILQNTKLNTSVSFADYLKANLAQVLMACALIAASLGILLLRSRKAEKAAKLAEERTAQANSEIQEINGQLEEHQAQLEELTAEQESQIEEITVLNNELEERQAQLEEATSEQESQLEEIQALNEDLEKKSSMLEQQLGIVGSLANTFQALYYVDMTDGSFVELGKSREQVENVIGKKGNAKASFEAMCNYLVIPEHKAEMESFTDLSTIQERLGSRLFISQQYCGQNGVWSEGFFVPVSRDEAGSITGLLWGVRFIDEFKQKELRAAEELTRAKEEAEAANNAKTSFLFNMSHDIRTPMNAIMGFRDLLEKHQEEPEKRADYLKKIEDSSKVLLSIINNVLEMARIEKGTLELDETAWSAGQFCDTLYAVFEEMMSQKGIQLTCSVDVQHQYVYCDPIKLREVFFNILSNAYKYTNNGGSVSMHVEEIPSDREGYAMYQTTITDTGIGMSEEFLPHIFEEFARERNTTDNKIEGTGLGMPIVKRLIELMDGSIEIRSEKGVGSTFVVTLPHRIAEKSSLVNHAGVEIDPALFEGKRILLVEDNDLNAEIAVEILTEAGFIVDRAEDGVICCEKIADAQSIIYDLILMDIQMPNMNGYDATRAIRQMEDTEKANIPILAMTANAFEEDKREAIRAGMNGHLSKPVNVTELMKALAGILG